MDNSFFIPIMLRFVLGGGAVVAATLLARAAGGRIGGIFAAFPAVYLAAILSLALDFSGDELVSMSLHVSEGALIGMIADIICALAASYLISRSNWVKGLSLSLLVWCISASGIFLTLQLFIR